MNFPTQSSSTQSNRSLAFCLLYVLASLMFAPLAEAASGCPCTSPVNVYPNLETFDSYSTCPLDGLQCSTACTIPGVWQNVTKDSIDWTVAHGKSPTSRTGPSTASTPNTNGNYIYMESSCPDIGHPDKQAFLQSKCFNFNSIAAPELNFDYHMFGEEMGDLHVEVSTDDCATWQEIAAISGPQQASSSEPWRTQIVSLADYSNRPDVRVRLRGVTGKDQFSDLAVDNILVKQAPAKDIALVDILDPSSGCGLTAPQTVTVLIENFGYNSQTNFPVSYQVDDGASVTETFTGILPAGSQAVYSFSTKADLSSVGQHTISALVSLSGDERNTNDLNTKNVVHVPTITTYPYSENFESGPGGWVAGGTLSTWAFGTPAKSVISGAASGVNAWVTGGLDTSDYRNSEASQVVGPCFNFTNLKFPVVGLKTWWNSENNYDGAVLQSSINGGQTWQTVGNYLDSANWYNNNALIGMPGGQYSGWSGSVNDPTPGGSGGWLTSGNILSGLAGKSSVRLRMAFGSDPIVRDDGFAFDDVIVREGLTATKVASFVTDANNNGKADPGDVIKYTVTLTSNSFQNITSVIFDDSPDPGTLLVTPNQVTTTKGSVTIGNAAGNTAVRVSVGTLLPGTSAVITFKVTVKPTAGAQVCNQGTVTGNGFTGFPTNDPAKSGLFNSTCVSGCADSDGDGISDCNDGCPDDPLKIAPGQCGCGVADTDSDGDGTANCHDSCPNDPSKITPGVCGCGTPETDSDGDGTPNCQDSCPNDPNKTSPQVCGCGVAETDSDSDGVPNCQDQCPIDPSKTQPGQCGCGTPDTDSDSDGTPNCHDSCPNDPAKILPGVCGCGTADTDSDGDGMANCQDNCPNDPNKTQPGACGCGTSDIDSDNNGIPDCNDICPPGQNIDPDNDGVLNCHDGCPNDHDKTAPGACGCGIAETDSDSDGVPNCIDLCPNDPAKSTPGACGCGTADTDSDNDGTPNCHDSCPSDPTKTSPGVCGCGTADTDSDSDGTPNCHDSCPNDPAKIVAGQCGCGVADTDSDNDGTANCHDLCPNDATKTSPGACGCGIADTDTDGDGVPNCHDSCQNDPNKTSPGACGCGVADTDSDSDGTPNCHDSCPSDPFKSAPGLCGCGVSDIDSDDDGTPNCLDVCPADPTKILAGACGCGHPETDDDHDGTPNCIDQCPSDPNKIVPKLCGCGVPDTDSDNDGVVDCQDLCPADGSKIAPGVCGCGVSDVDSDGDGIADCQDACPADKNKTSPGVCGCGVADTDSDGDGAANCIDQCPNDPGKVVPGLCGCGVSESQAPGCVDLCPLDPLKSAPGVCGCGVKDEDLNNNGITDCLVNPDLKKQLSDLSTMLRKVKLITKKISKAQNALRKTIYNQMGTANSFIVLHQAQITTNNSSKPLTKQLQTVAKSVGKLVKAKNNKLIKSYRTQALKGLTAMNKILP